MMPCASPTHMRASKWFRPTRDCFCWRRYTKTQTDTTLYSSFWGEQFSITIKRGKHQFSSKGNPKANRAEGTDPTIHLAAMLLTECLPTSEQAKWGFPKSRQKMEGSRSSLGSQGSTSGAPQGGDAAALGAPA